MIERLEKQLQVLVIQRNSLSILTATALTPSTLSSFTATLRSIHSISSQLNSLLSDLLQPEHYRAIFDTLIFSTDCALAQLAIALPKIEETKYK